VLLALLEDMHARAGIARARVLPWPTGVRWVLNVRHDFDRPLDAGAVKAILKKHRAAGTSATWYWRARHLRGRNRDHGLAAIKAVAREPSHEVALHTENQFADPAERTDIEKAARTALRGTSAHGDPTCFRFQGAPNVLWADREGFDYTELIQHAHFHPHRFAALGPDGDIEIKRIVCLPHHESFDLSTTPGNVNAERVGELPALWGEPGGFAQVLNHPDINIDLLFDALAALPADGRVEWTAAQASDWWRRTHVQGELTLERIDDDSVRVSSRTGVYVAVLELRAPDGAASRFVLDLEPETPLTIRRGSQGVISSDERALPSSAQVRWDRELGPAFVSRIRAYYTERGADPDSAASQTTLRTNSELVPSRAADVLAFMDTLAGVGRLDGRRVLEAGCGFGALAAYLALAHNPASVVGVDHEPAFLEVGREVAATHGMEPRLDFVEADLRDLTVLGDEPFDVVIANNSLLYLTGEQDLDSCLRELRRLLKPGGVLFVYQANRLRWRDPFTGAPGVTLVPKWAVAGLTRLTRRSHSLDRVRLMSASELGRALGRAGFSDPALGAMERGRVSKRVRFARFIAAAGRA
jgi:SAM-dependent methyltransferase